VKFGNGETTLASEIQRAKINTPDLYKRYFSRIYRDDHRFGDWRLPLWYDIAGVKLLFDHFDEVKTNPVDTSELIISWMKGTNQAPMFFVTKELFNACLNTQVPEDLNVADLKLPFEAFTFVLPRNSLFRGNEEAQFITVGRIKKGKTTIYKGEEVLTSIQSEQTSMAFSTFFPEAMGQLSILSTGDDLGKILKEKEVTYADDETRYALNISRNPSDPRRRIVKSIDKDFVSKMVPLAMSLILAMEARPELVVSHRYIRPGTKSGKGSCWLSSDRFGVPT
jgi:hypothetical protein